MLLFLAFSHGASRDRARLTHPARDPCRRVIFINVYHPQAFTEQTSLKKFSGAPGNYGPPFGSACGDPTVDPWSVFLQKIMKFLEERGGIMKFLEAEAQKERNFLVRRVELEEEIEVDLDEIKTTLD